MLLRAFALWLGVLAACVGPAAPSLPDAGARDTGAHDGIPEAPPPPPLDADEPGACAEAAARTPATNGMVAVRVTPGQRTACGVTSTTTGFVNIAVPPRRTVVVTAGEAVPSSAELTLQSGCGEAARCLSASRGPSVSWTNASLSPAAVVAALAFPPTSSASGAFYIHFGYEAQPRRARCATAEGIYTAAPAISRPEEAGDAVSCGPGEGAEPAVHYWVWIPPETGIRVVAAREGGGETTVAIRSSCDAVRCLASARGAPAQADHQNRGRAAESVLVSVSHPSDGTGGPVALSIVRLDAAGREPDPSYQPPRPRVGPGAYTCSYDNRIPFQHEPGEVSTLHRAADAPLAWSLGAGEVLWLSHPALEGRTVAGLTPGETRDLLVARAPDGRVTGLVTAKGVSAVADGLAATAEGVLMVVRVTSTARIAGRPVAAPAGLALARFERTGALSWVEALPSVEVARLGLAPDGVARLVATTTAPSTLRGVPFGGVGRRLTLVRFDARDAPGRAVDLGADPGPLDELIGDDDGALRMRVGDEVLAFDPDGALRWRATLPPGTHRLRRDGTAWTLANSCEELRTASDGPSPRDPLDTWACVSVLSRDGRARALRPLTQPSSPDRRLMFSTSALTLHEALDGTVSIARAGSGCQVLVGPAVSHCGDYALRWTLGDGVPAPFYNPSAAPRCVQRALSSANASWTGALACRRACAGAGACGPPIDLTTASDCGALGRSCAEALEPLHLRGRCGVLECAPTGCLPGWGDCNGDLADGCEVDLARAAAHCGACGNACAGRCDGGRCCGGAGCAAGVFESDGSEGAFAPTEDVTLRSGVHHFTRIDIPADVTVRVGVGGVLDLRATEAVHIDGTLELSGGDAYLEQGGATGRRVAGGGPSGTGSGPGGGASTQASARGDAPGESAAGMNRNACGGRPDYPQCSGQPMGGRAGAPAYDGVSGTGVASCTDRYLVQVYRCIDEDPGAGSIGPRALRDLPVLSHFATGSGGGSARCSEHAFTCGSPVGGGGGGGALRVASRVSIALGPRACVRADGGGVPFSYDPWTFESSQGDGSGGVVSLAAPSVAVAAGAYVSAVSRHGGLGRVKLSVDPLRCRVEGTFHPPLPRGCVPSTHDALCETYVAAWPW